MDAQRERQNSSDYDTGYSSYGNEADVNSAKAQLERQLLKDEYEADREAILIAIKDTYREMNYDEAKRLIARYRPVAHLDEDFLALERLVKMEDENRRTKKDKDIEIRPGEMEAKQSAKLDDGSHSSVVARAVERDLILEEYREDRETIHEMIKGALKKHDYKEAQVFIHKYRAAIKIDENFSILAKLTAQGLEKEKKIEKVKTILDVTDENDYTRRQVLYEKLLKIDPSNEEYIEGLQKCKEAQGLAQVDKKKDVEQKFETCPIATSVLCVIDLICFAACAEGEMVIGAWIFLPLIMLFHIWSLNFKSSIFKKQSATVKILLNILCGFIIICIYAGLFV